MRRWSRSLFAMFPVLVVACGGETAAPAPVDSGVSDAPADAADESSSPIVYHPWTPDAASPMTPLQAPSETWTFVPFPDSRCGNGTPGGIGVNLTTRSTRVLIYMQGGGGCWDTLTCHLVGTASNLNNDYNDGTFRAEIRAMSGDLMFSRTDARNPFRDASFVYVPYCTGDIHGGDNVMVYDVSGTPTTTWHVGARNMDAYLRRLALTFPTTDRVWLTGMSAGGYGAGINWDRVQRAFPAARVDMLDDSGPPIDPPEARFLAMKTAWNIQFPEGCTRCNSSLSALFDFYATRFAPPHRMGLLSYTHDSTIPTYFGISGAQFEMQLNDLTRTSFDPHPNFRYFVTTGSMHTMMGHLDTVTGPGGATLLDWVTGWANDSPTWSSVHP